MVDLYNQYLGICDDINCAINEVIEDSDFIQGAAVRKLEAELSRFLNVKHCITCGNGTDAIILSLMAIGLKRGDEVVVPAFSFAAVAEAVIFLGGVPVFADVDPCTFNIDPVSVERVVSSRTKAVIPVHLFGQPCDMAEIMKIAEKYGLAVIEDNAQSLGAECYMPDGSSRYAGTVGHIGCTSFFPSKVLGCFGDGGAVFTNDDAFAERIRALSNHGQISKYDHRFIGLNTRLDTIQAAVLRTKLPYLKQWISSRRKAAGYYTSKLTGMPLVEVPVVSSNVSHIYHQYTIKVAPDSRDGLKIALGEAGIASMIYYPMPLFKQPAYCNSCVCDPMMLNSAKLSASVLSLPMHSELTNMQQDLVVDTIRRYFVDNKY